MKLMKGNMWDVFGNTDLFLITTNPIRRKDGAVVMGRGIAKEAAKRFPDLPYDFGRKLSEPDFEMPCNSDLIGTYDGQDIGYFMVKSHWKLPAELTIIEDSLVDLTMKWQAQVFLSRIDLNFPGIGNGKLARDKVLPLLEKYLPDNVHVWEY